MTVGQALKQAIDKGEISIPSHSEAEATRVCEFCGTTVPPVSWSLLGKPSWAPGRCLCADQREAENAARLAQQEQEKRSALYARAFPAAEMGSMLRATLENFERRSGSENALLFAERYLKGLPNPDPPGLALWGQVGNGKSHLSAAIAQAARGLTMGVAWVHTPSWLRLIGTLDPGRRESQIDLASSADLLVLDELGGGKLTVSRADWLLSVLDVRYRKRLPLVITTNKSPKELPITLTPVGDDAADADIPDGARIVDRLMEMAVFVENKAASYREELAVRRLRDMMGEPPDGQATG